MRGRSWSILALGMLIFVAACSLPRGAPTKSEITGKNNVPDDVTVEQVTQSSVAKIQAWPSSGWHGHYQWLNRVPGPESRLIRPGDMITLTVWDNQENSLLLPPQDRKVQVRPVEVTTSGTIFVPYVDEVSVGGLTPEQARATIQSKLAPIAPSAQAQVEVSSGARNSVDLVSGVASPGPIALVNRNTSILSILAAGGGISPSIENPVVRLMRDGQSYEIPARTLLKDPGKNVIVRGGDQIIVDEDDRYFVALGATETEKQVYFHQDTITALEAVSILGGLQDARANPQGLLLLRQYPNSAIRSDGSGPPTQYVVFSFDLSSPEGLFGARNFYVNPSDVVMATESAVKPAQALIALLGSLFAINNVF